MSVSSRFVRFSMAIALCMAIGVGVLGEDVAKEEEDIANPFSRKKAPPPVTPPAPPASPLDNFEFNGLMILSGEIEISLYDKKENRSYWLSLNEANEKGLVVERYDQAKKGGEESIILRSGIHTKRVALKNADIVTAQPIPVSNGPQPSVGPKPPPKVAEGKPASDEEVRERMQRVAEQIRRRRALRRKMLDEQATQPGN